VVDIGAQLHFLKGSALNLGFADFSDLCHRGEGAAGAGRGAEVNLAEILDCFDRSKVAFLAGLTAEVVAA